MNMSGLVRCKSCFTPTLIFLSILLLPTACADTHNGLEEPTVMNGDGAMSGRVGGLSPVGDDDASVEDALGALGQDATGPLPAPTTDIDPKAMEVARLLSGKFSSEAQSKSNPSYFNIHLASCLVSAPDYGELVLYVEQAAGTSLNQPYRQRLYVITADEEIVRSEIWAPAVATAWIGTCDAPGVVDVPEGAFSTRQGCDVWLTSNGQGYVGSTKGEGCASSLSGASYATSEVTLSDTMLRSWDRGFNAQGLQVWGATMGPYDFDRLTDIVAPESWSSQVLDLL